MLGEILLPPPPRGIQQQRPGDPRTLGRKWRRRPPARLELIGAPLHRAVKIVLAQPRVAGEVDPVQVSLGGGLRPAGVMYGTTSTGTASPRLSAASRSATVATVPGLLEVFA